MLWAVWWLRVPVYAFWLGWSFSGAYGAIQIEVTNLMHKRRHGYLGWFSTSRKTGMPGFFSERHQPQKKARHLAAEEQAGRQELAATKP